MWKFDRGQILSGGENILSDSNLDLIAPLEHSLSIKPSVKGRHLIKLSAMFIKRFV